MFAGRLITDFNGIVLIEPALLRARYGGSIADGTDLFTRYRTTDEGDEVLKDGIIVPVLAIDDHIYDVVVRLSTQPSPVVGEIVAENGVFPLRVVDTPVLADLAVLKEWCEQLGWLPVPISPGMYGVTVRGFKHVDLRSGRLVSAGYEFVLQLQSELPPLTADTGKNMRLFR